MFRSDSSSFVSHRNASNFFGRTVTNRSMEDDLATQAVDLVFKNDALKKKATPYLAGVLLFNIVLFLMLLYLVIRVSIKQSA